MDFLHLPFLPHSSSPTLPGCSYHTAGMRFRHPPCLLQQLDHGKRDLCYQLLSSTSCGDLEWLTFVGSFFPLVLQPLNSTIPEEVGSHGRDLLHESGCHCHKNKKRALPWHLEVQLSLKLAAAVTDAACSVKNHHRNTQDMSSLCGIQTLKEKAVYAEASSLFTHCSYNDYFNHVYTISITSIITDSSGSFWCFKVCFLSAHL